MEENNLEYLKKTLDYLGFGTRLNEVLTSAVYRELTHFSLGINQSYIPSESQPGTEAKSDLAHFQLHFNRSAQSENYFLDRFVLTLQRYDNSPARIQEFSLERHHRMSALQAYKLLCGQSLQKEITVKSSSSQIAEKQQVWFKLDGSVRDENGNRPLLRFYPGYGYDLEQTFLKYPFANLDAQQQSSAIKALRFGNLIQLPIDHAGAIEQVFTRANPQHKVLDLFTLDMKPIYQTTNQIPQASSTPSQSSEHATKNFSESDQSQLEQAVQSRPKR